MINNKIYIVIFSQSDAFMSHIKYGLSNDNSISILGYARNLNDFKRFEGFGSYIAVLDVYSSNVQLIDSVIEYLESKSLFFMSVCENATMGFEMMKKGSLSIIINKDCNNKFEQQSFIKSFIIKVKDSDKIRSLMGKRTVKKEVSISSNKIIVIGSSTGGTEAVLAILKRLPENVPPILVVQHMPSVFTRMYADRLNDVCKITVWEARDKDILKPGLAMIAPGEMQMKLVRKPEGLMVECFKGEKVNGHAPSVDVLFNTVADVAGRNAIGIILTGMGSDGAKGLLKMHKKGAYTIGQDEKSCVVYGMPKVAYDLGAVDIQLDINDIASHVLTKI